MKTWLITLEPPICGTEQYYMAISDEDPLLDDNFPFNYYIEETWNDYNYLLHLDDEEYESEEEEKEAYDEAYEEWFSDCQYDSEEMDEEHLKEYGINGGLPDIIYDTTNS